ncbi:hypothetical protein PTSG_04033 [Salpingoeca rosetta]|uniref:Uncharacterized protein n=1 Tax=Salpingoeca rosetta (strain ATCC 50818 / BSB-021) TaxID=946362 RepID=F2U7K9_SALR5|nr:uncharacterized protein PTSG_04033 [Salpingoeca rosetta]EGD83426.1 hypothetical protein PTSG_04033 [Salpingoeca rosetta]|eukprot:XP_004994930.1 hypothetical protein PTSG_04033 [Salpingoeca rosetta]
MEAQLFNRCVLKLNTAQSPQLALAHLYSETVRLKNKLSELQDVQEGERDNWQSAYDELHTAIDEGLQQERTVISFGRALLLAKDRRLADLQAAASRAESRVGSLESAATSQPQSQSQSQSQSRPHSRQSHYSTPSLPSSHEASSVATQHVQRTQQSRTPASTPASRPSTANTTASTMSPSQALRPSLQSSASTDLDLAPSPVRAATSPRKKRFIRRTGTIGTLTRKAGGGGGGANASGRTTAAASSTTSASFVKSLHFSRDRQADDDGAETTKRPKITPAKDAVVAADPSAVSPQDDERLLEEL